LVFPANRGHASVYQLAAAASSKNRPWRLDFVM
jgi:hypothetical protein